MNETGFDEFAFPVLPVILISFLIIYPPSLLRAI